MYPRELQKVINHQLNRPEVILIYGARQTGKSTLLDLLREDVADGKFSILNCENPLIADALSSMNIEKIKMLFGAASIVALDEAQVIPDIGRILKYIYDDKQSSAKIIATGSSSFDLSNSAGEPLTGRNVTFRLYPLSLNELKMQHGWLKVMERLDDLLIYGSYPAIVDMPPDLKQQKLISLTSDYLFKDIFKFDRLRNPMLLRKLLKALALQTGSLVNFNELAQLTGVSPITIERYLDLLEKSFVVFSVGSYSGNLRNELKKSRKYYFYDNGIRNALINNFAMPANRTDMGALWENFCISQVMKRNEYSGISANLYFWRTYDGAEIDLVEERDGQLSAWEFKWNPRKKAKAPAAFAGKYSLKSFRVINPENIHELIE